MSEVTLTPTEERVLRQLARADKRWWSVEDLALAISERPTIIRSALHELRRRDLVTPMHGTRLTTGGESWACTTLGEAEFAGPHHRESRA